MMLKGGGSTRGDHMERVDWVGRNGGHLRAVTFACLLLSSVTLLAPGLTRDAAALQIRFSRPNVLVDNGGANVEGSPAGGPSMAVGVDGILHAVWSDSRSITEKGIYYAQSFDEGASWTMKARIDGSTGSNNVAPSIAVDTSMGAHSGNIYIVWQRGEMTSADIYFVMSADGGLTWVNRNRIDSAPLNVPSMYPRITVDGLGTVYVAFMDGGGANEDIYFARSDTGGSSWTPDTLISNDASVNFYPAISSCGTLVGVAWEERDTAGVKLLVAVSSDKGATWLRNSIISISSGLGNLGWVSLAVDDKGKLHASWTLVDPSGIQSVVYSQSDDKGVTWSSPVQVSDNSPNRSYYADSSTVLATPSILYVVWTDSRNGDSDIFASWSMDNGATWGDGIPGNDVRVDDTDNNGPLTDDATIQTAPGAASSRFGLYVIWSDMRDGASFRAYAATFQVGEVLITEVRDAPDGVESIEFFNRMTYIMDVTGWHLDIDGSPFSLSPIGSIPPGGYRTVGDDPSSDLQIDVTLDDEGGTLQLFDQAGVLRDSMAYGQRGPAPDPLTLESVARVYHGGAYREYWTRAKSPTFRMQNGGSIPDSSSGVVINEVFYNAGNPALRFVELYYRGDSSADMTGFDLVGDATHTLPAVTLNTTNRYLVISPTQAPGLFSALDAAGDNLYLYDSAGALVDMVGWTAPHSQGESACRAPEGFGLPEGYDDASSSVSGWRFDCVPSPHLIGIGPPGTVLASMGDTVEHNLTVVNFMDVPALVDLSWNAPPPEWTVGIFASDGVTPLTDTNMDSWPDVSLGRFGTGSGTVKIVVRIGTQATAESNDTVLTRVVAVAQPEGRDSVDLVTGFYPYLAINRSANPKEVYVRGTGYGEETTITLDLDGRGMKIPGKDAGAADVVFVIDDTGSMGGWIDAVKKDVDGITNSLVANVTDIRFGLVSYKDVPDIDLDLGLTGNVALFKLAVFGLLATGGGDEPEDPDVALDLAAHLSWRMGAIPKVMILVGDSPAHDNTHLAEVAEWAYNNLNIHTNAIGCGDKVTMIKAFQAASAAGHGFFTQLGTPDAMADAIIKGIMDVIPPIDYAAEDTDVSDGDPMVRDALPAYIAFVPGTFMDPATMAPKPPEFTGTDSFGNTVLEWNVSVLKVNSSWSVQFNVTSSLTGVVLTNVWGHSRVSFTNWSGAHIFIDFPKVWITVSSPQPLPDLTLATSDIVMSPPAPYLEGLPLYLNATVHNVGQGMSESTFVRYHDGFPPSPQVGADQPIPPVAVGGTAAASVVWTPTVPGVHNICVVVDPMDGVRETDETNNLACVVMTVQPTKPDYIPVSPLPSNAVKIGLSQLLQLSVQVLNQGDKSANATATLALYNESDPANPFATFTVPPLDGSETSSRFTATWRSPATPGTRNVAANVDYHNNVTESSETNNVFAWTVNVVPEPITSLVMGSPNYTSAATYVRSSTPLSFEVMDESGLGIRDTTYRIDGGVWVNYTASGQLDLTGKGEGQHLLEWFSEDYAGNVEGIRRSSLVVDDTPPSTSIQPGDSSVSVDALFSLAADDGQGCGVAALEYRIDGGSWNAYLAPLSLAEGWHNITYRSWDHLNNTIETMHPVKVVSAELPPGGRVEVNYKPIVALMFAIVLLVAGVWSSKRRPWKGGKDKMAVLKAFTFTSMPFVLAEAMTGVVSFLTGQLSMPPLVGAGTAVDLAILLAGLAVAILRVRTGPSEVEKTSTPQKR